MNKTKHCEHKLLEMVGWIKYCTICDKEISSKWE
jgi:hypothetical protein